MYWSWNFKLIIKIFIYELFYSLLNILRFDLYHLKTSTYIKYFSCKVGLVSFSFFLVPKSRSYSWFLPSFQNFSSSQSPSRFNSRISGHFLWPKNGSQQKPLYYLWNFFLPLKVLYMLEPLFIKPLMRE